MRSIKSIRAFLRLTPAGSLFCGPVLALASATVLIAAVPGCKERPEKADASQQLQESFQAAEPEIKQAIEVASTSLKAGNYAEATRALAPVVEQRVLTEPQKQAVGIAIQQMNQAIAANSSLDTREMYELREKMFQATRRGSRF